MIEHQKWTKRTISSTVKFERDLPSCSWEILEEGCEAASEFTLEEVVH